MNRNYFNVFLYGALAFSTAAFVGCKDYDDDIENLQSQITKNASDIASLKSDFGSIAYVTGVSFSNGVLTVVSTSGTNTYTIPNTDTNTTYTISGEKKDGKIVLTLKGSDGTTSTYEFTDDDTDTKFDASKLTVEDGVVKYDGQATGVTVSEAESFDPTKLTLEDGVIKYNGVATGVTIPEVTVPTYSVTAVADAAGNVKSYLVKYGEESSTLIITDARLKSLVFIPDFYWKGIEAMEAPTFQYKALKGLKTVSADDTEGNKDVVTSTEDDETEVTKGLVATYHINPSNVDPKLLTKDYLSFVVGNKEYRTRAGGITVTDASVEDGILTVNADITGLTIADGSKEVTVAALQAKYSGNDGDTLITSDYAAIQKVVTTGFVLANPKVHVKGHTDEVEGEGCHLYTTAAAAINADPVDSVAYDKTIDIAEYVQTHYQLEGATSETAWDANANDGTVKKYNFSYEYALVGYVGGNNNTSESAHAALKGSVLRPQSVDGNGKAQDYDESIEPSKANVGRQPLVRVLLKDNNSGKYVAGGYLKFKIVEEAVTPETKTTETFTITDKYVLSCERTPVSGTLKWYDVENKIIALLGISKATFEANYELDDKTSDAKQFVKNGDSYTELAADKKIGTVSISENDNSLDEGTNVITWSLTADKAAEYFLKSASISTIVRFKHKSADAYVYVPITWTPNPRSIDRSGSLSNDKRIAEKWYASNNKSPKSGYAEIHANSLVPNTATTTVTYTNDILLSFENQKVEFTNNAKDLKGYATEELTQKFIFKVPASPNDKVTGTDGNTYKLSVSEDGSTLQATLLKDGKENGDAYDIAVLSGSKNEISNNSIEYQKNSVAMALLNYAGHNELGNNETLRGTLQFVACNSCDELTLTNSSFDVKFLRPVDIEKLDNPGNLEDGVADGSKINLAKVIKLVDWRDVDFATPETGLDYFTFYNVKSIIADVSKITCDLNSNNFKDNAKDKFGLDITFDPVSSITKDDMGTLTYKNNGFITGTFNIQVPVTVTYEYGEVTKTIQIEVKYTKAQSNVKAVVK